MKVVKNHCVMIAVTKKKCRDCNEMKSVSKTDFYLYKNGKMYSTCEVCFNKNVRCELYNKELNKSYLRSHIKKQHMREATQHNYMQHNYQPRVQWHKEQQRYNGSGIGSGVYNAASVAPSNAISGAACVGVSGGPSRGASGLACGVACAVACNSENNADSENNRTLKVGPSFCGKTHLLLNKLRLIRLEDPERQIRIITRSPEQYEFIEVGDALRDVSVEENVKRI